MTFDRVLPLLRSGYKMRRAHWIDSYIYYSRQDKTIYRGNMVWSNTQEDLLADDWYVYEGKR